MQSCGNDKRKVILCGVLFTLTEEEYQALYKFMVKRSRPRNKPKK